MYSDIIAYGVVRSQSLEAPFSTDREQAQRESGEKRERASQPPRGPAVDQWLRGWLLELHARQPLLWLAPNLSSPLEEVLRLS